jgi:hypothetical protein
MNLYGDSVERLSLPFYPQLNIPTRYILRLMVQRPFNRLEINTMRFS